MVDACGHLQDEAVRLWLAVTPFEQSSQCGTHAEPTLKSGKPFCNQCMETKGLLGRLHFSASKKVASMQTFFIVLLIWCAPSFLFVGWRLWMSRPIRDVHYRHRWEFSHALVHPGPTSQLVHFRN
jgi:hypothetical protein